MEQKRQGSKSDSLIISVSLYRMAEIHFCACSIKFTCLASPACRATSNASLSSVVSWSPRMKYSIHFADKKAVPGCVSASFKSSNNTGRSGSRKNSGTFAADLIALAKMPRDMVRRRDVDSSSSLLFPPFRLMMYPKTFTPTSESGRRSLSETALAVDRLSFSGSTNDDSVCRPRCWESNPWSCNIFPTIASEASVLGCDSDASSSLLLLRLLRFSSSSSSETSGRLFNDVRTGGGGGARPMAASRMA
mmetsp:Transcript_54499/g.132293  ORF Transcript_54499/g.132293 Transcript_54499/m.132293 type:complete len:248 (+) Transcript_54499:429-1172(+)